MVEVLDPVEVTAAPEQWRCIGEEISEQLDYEPGQFLRRQLVRRKFVFKNQVDAVPVIAPLPARLLERSLPPAGLLAQIVVSRFVDHLPYYRQEQIFWTRACWAHCRRKFFEARELDPGPIGWVLRQIGQLYHIEEQLRQKRCSPALREFIRAQQSRPIYERLHRLFIRWKSRHKYLPKSGLGQAVTYALNLWPQLGLYLQKGRIEIDQNLVENAIRPTALGKKNWLFIGAADAGQRSAILYTIVESCRRRKIDPYSYLREVLTRLPHATNWQIKDLTPEAWARSLQAQAA